jgi:hypothetical protein
VRRPPTTKDPTMSKLNNSSSLPAAKAFGLLTLLALGVAPSVAQAETATVTTSTAFGWTDSTGNTKFFTDPTPPGAHISSVTVSNEFLPGWLSTVHVGQVMYRLNDTYIADTYPWGTGTMDTWVPLSDTYEMCNAGLWGTPVLAFVKDGLNSLTVQGWWNLGSVSAVTLEFTYQMDGPDADCDGVADSPNDTDNDGVADGLDVCPGADDNVDFDLDGAPDGCDNCATVANADQADGDDDGTGNACDDGDGDGVLDMDDNCPDASNADQGDSDADSAGDACDDDDDDDGVADLDDNCQLFPNDDQADYDSDGDGDVCDGDVDGDFVLDFYEPSTCLNTPLDVAVGADGCSGTQYVETICGVCASHPNTGKYVSCVSRASNVAHDAGLLTGKQKAGLVSEAAKSCK